MADGNLPQDQERVEEERLPKPEDNPRNKRMMEIAAAEEESKTDLVDVADEDYDKTVDVVDELPAVVEEKVVPKRKITVNGVERELTEDEITKLAERSAGADEKFQEAARLRKEAEELRKQPSKEEAAPVGEEDPKALARAIQMGSEEEAAAVIEKLMKRPSVSNADAQRMIDQRLEFRSATDWFQSQYPDIVKDSNLLKLVLSEDEKLVEAGDRRPYKVRYEQIGNSLRKWRDGLKAPASTTEKVERKAHLQVVPAASVRSAAPREENDGPTDREFIAQEAKRRGQGYPK